MVSFFYRSFFYISLSILNIIFRSFFKNLGAFITLIFIFKILSVSDFYLPLKKHHPIIISTIASKTAKTQSGSTAEIKAPTAKDKIITPIALLFPHTPITPSIFILFRFILNVTTYKKILQKL